MNHKIEILKKEVELEEIREEKAKLIAQMKYQDAAKLRDQEILTEKLLKNIIYQLSNRIINSNLNSTNYYKIQDTISFLSRYNSDINIELKHKIGNLQLLLVKQNSEAIEKMDFDLSHKLNTEINFFKNK